jgi:hypothetical protein
MSARTQVVVGRIALLVFVLSAAVACDDGGGDGRAMRVTHPRTPDQAIVEVTVAGGIAPPEVQVSDTLPLVWLAGDGRHLVASHGGASAPALAPLEERRLTPSVVQRFLRQAQQAGLLDADADYGKPEIFDAVSTRVVVVADGGRHDVVVRALGYPVTDLDGATLEARAEVSRFVNELEDPGSLPGAGEPRRYVPAEVAVFVLDPATSTLAPASWPLGDLATLGAPTGWPTETTRCFVVSGAEVATLNAIATKTSRSTPWQSAGSQWQIAFRPLLPDEHTCADVVP